MTIYALVPARYGSKGVPMKNHRALAGGLSPMWLAVNCAMAVDAIDCVVVSADSDEAPWNAPEPTGRLHYLRRRDELAQDDTPMLAVVQDAMLSYPGMPDDVWLIVQPTQPLRTSAHVQAAITLLEESGADSVVSVVVLPLTHAPEFQCVIGDGLKPARWWCECGPAHLEDMNPCRQDVGPAYIRDGTVYAFRRSTVTRYGNIYGQDVRPLIIPPEETCPLDTEADWAEAERRLTR